MDKSFLERYAAEEAANMEDVRQECQQGEFDALHKYLKVRLGLVEPYAYACPFEEVWPIIPFYRTTVVKIYPFRNRKYFEQYHGLEIEDIPRLIRSAESEGRIKFVLVSHPQKYEGMDFLEPLLRSDIIRPPVLPEITDLGSLLIGGKAGG